MRLAVDCACGDAIEVVNDLALGVDGVELVEPVELGRVVLGVYVCMYIHLCVRVREGVRVRGRVLLSCAR